MEKLKAEIRKYKVPVRYIQGKIFEEKPTLINSYFEEESLSGVTDRVAFRTRFIETVVGKITRQNKQEEERAKLTKKGSMIKLVVHKIFTQ